MSFRLKLQTAPALEPVTTAEAKLHLRVDGSDEDALIGSLVSAARDYAERYTRRAFVSQVWRMYMDFFPSCRWFYLPRSPLISVNAITYKDENGAVQTLAASAYVADSAQEVPARVALAEGEDDWPETFDEIQAVTVEFTAGYGAAASAVPESIKAAIKLLVGHWFENRETVVIGSTPNAVPLAAMALLDSRRIMEAPVLD